MEVPIDAPRLAAALGCKRLFIKDEGQNPTGSFKDRSASYTITKMVQQGARGVVLQSTGNAAASFAVYAARAGLGCQVIVPTDVLDSNVEQIRRSGARLIKLEDWSRATKACSELAIDTGYIDVSAANTPFKAYAKQSLGYEIMEQCGDALPEAIFCPTGGGVALLALKAAFAACLGSSSEYTAPRLFASQYIGCAPIVKAHQAGNARVSPWSVIDTPRGGMRTASPSLGTAVLAAIKTGGAYAIEPSAAAQFAAQSARGDGVLVGLECGTAIAAVSAAINGNLIREDASVMVINTASLLKFDPMYLISSEA